MYELADVRSGEKIVDGKTICDLDNSVVKDRLQLAEDGICVVVLAVNAKTGEVISGPELIPRGFIYPNEMTGLIKEARQATLDALKSTGADKIDWQEMKGIVRRVLGNLFFRKTKRNPMIIPVIMEL